MYSTPPLLAALLFSKRQFSRVRSTPMTIEGGSTEIAPPEPKWQAPLLLQEELYDALEPSAQLPGSPRAASNALQPWERVRTQTSRRVRYSSASHIPKPFEWP